MPLVPDSCYLAGGTAITVHLQHRESRDLDFFYHRQSVDLDALCETFEATGSFVATKRGSGMLNGLLEETEVEFLHADEASPEHLLTKPTVESGFQIAGFPDRIAMKLRAVATRGEHRDFFDLQCIEQMTPFTIDDGLSYYVARHQPKDASSTILHIIRALGYMDEIVEDESLPLSKTETANYWKRRQPDILRNAGWLTRGGRIPPSPAPLPGATSRISANTNGLQWVTPHKRRGKDIPGYWRGRR